MCKDCGCLETSTSKSHDHMQFQKEEIHGHEEDSKRKLREVSIRQGILQKNDEIAQHNKTHLKQSGVFCMNWISAPGSGKTALLEKIITDLKGIRSIVVIEGDLQTDNDAKRIEAAGAQAYQINTGSACHLDAEMVHHAMHHLELKKNQILVIENVGNMVCPTAYDLGEDVKLAVISTPEGEDKPIKYPDLILAAEVLLINKIDLIPHLNFDLQQCINFAAKVNPNLTIFPVSALTGEGLNEFYLWLENRIPTL